VLAPTRRDGPPRSRDQQPSRPRACSNSSPTRELNSAATSDIGDRPAITKHGMSRRRVRCGRRLPLQSPERDKQKPSRDYPAGDEAGGVRKPSTLNHRNQGGYPMNGPLQPRPAVYVHPVPRSPDPVKGLSGFAVLVEHVGLNIPGPVHGRGSSGSHTARRLGVRRRLPQLSRAHRGARRLALVLQPLMKTLSPGPHAPDRPPRWWRGGAGSLLPAPPQRPRPRFGCGRELRPEVVRLHLRRPIPALLAFVLAIMLAVALSLRVRFLATSSPRRR